MLIESVHSVLKSGSTNGQHWGAVCDEMEMAVIELLLEVVVEVVLVGVQL